MIAQKLDKTSVFFMRSPSCGMGRLNNSLTCLLFTSIRLISERRKALLSVILALKDLSPIHDQMRRDYYKAMGRDEVTSKPLPDTIKRLELENEVKDLWG
jgi:hypothetical protein